MKIEDARKKIDALDTQIVDLFCERMNASCEIAKVKAADGLDIYNPVREREILDKVAAQHEDMELYTNRLYQTIFELSRAYQREFVKAPAKIREQIEAMRKQRELGLPERATVACQGVEGAYAQMAADRLFKRGSLMYMKSFEAVFDAVDKGLCQFGVLPIDNSTNGSVKQVYDLMAEKKFYIVASTQLFIKHELLAKKGTKLSDIKAVYSHDQGLNQCSAFLKTLPPWVQLLPSDNTATAAKFVAESGEPVAAISSHNCADIYGLEKIAGDIANNQNNYTKFIVIAKEPLLYEGANYISLLLTTEHRPGALFAIMARFAALDINLTKLESMPIPGEDFEFMFFFELQASVMDDRVADMLAELERSCETFQFLGNYTAL
ncbi:MAG: chorismate mutase [Clostridiales bacterium]|nr:chorismate mutase [Clostridiales bacterium]